MNGSSAPRGIVRDMSRPFQVEPTKSGPFWPHPRYDVFPVATKSAFIFHPPRLDRFLNAIRKGMSLVGASALVNEYVENTHAMLAEGRKHHAEGITSHYTDFVDRFNEAKGEAEERLIDRIAAASEFDWRAAETLLKSQPQWKEALSPGGTTQVNVNVDTVVQQEKVVTPVSTVDLIAALSELEKLGGIQMLLETGTDDDDEIIDV